MTNEFWRSRRVFITGHTGFKGAWLALSLHSLGARVHGYSLPPPTKPSLFDVAGVGDILESNALGDVRDLVALRSAMQAANPEVVFHLAAQSLVRPSYDDPLGTFTTNVIGTANVLEVLRHIEGVRAAVIVTSDKCYENAESDRALREMDPMGGYDPYSSSKGCAELVTSAFRRSFFADGRPSVASARAGNIIGGGDWAPDRLVPDLFRALDAGRPLQVRSPNSVRPWQHVLESVAGYLTLAEKLSEGGPTFAEAWNFGPPAGSIQTVAWIVDFLCARTGVTVETHRRPIPHEANYLSLNSNKARERLAWTSRWSIDHSLEKTLAWHAAWRSGADMRKVTLEQIDDYNDFKGSSACRASTSHRPGLTVSS